MDHGPATEWKAEKDEAFKVKLGLINFGAYTVIYFIFVFLCVLNPKLMATNVGTLNLAIVYGLFLIILGIVQAIIYNMVLSRREKLLAQSTKA
jgi:uncharacterized membrane protein (DUF485 family)